MADKTNSTLKLVEILSTAYQDNSWIVEYNLDIPEELDYSNFQDGGDKNIDGYEGIACIPMYPNCAVKLITCDDEEGKLDFPTLVSGMSKMQEMFPEHYERLMDGTYDVIDADLYIQICVFGEEVYS